MGEMRNVYKILTGEPDGKRQLGTASYIWEDTIKK
jgi:hypothetical protein